MMKQNYRHFTRVQLRLFSGLVIDVKHRRHTTVEPLLRSAHTMGLVPATSPCNKSQGLVASCELAIFATKSSRRDQFEFVGLVAGTKFGLCD